MKKNKFVLAALVFSFGISKAQQSQLFRDKNQYQQDLAQQLYQQNIYAASHQAYTDLHLYNTHIAKSEKVFSGFYMHLIEVLLQYPNAEQGLESFIVQHPEASSFNNAKMPLVDYYLLKKDFAKAKALLNQINPNQLSPSETTQYALKLGYAEFMTGNSAVAIKTLSDIYDTAEEPSKSDIAYMLGHLYYTNQQNAEALTYFDTIRYKEKYNHLVQPYYVQMYYQNKDYNRAISEGENILNENLADDYKAEVHKIIGESYFMQQNYSAAYPHLKQYFDYKTQPSESDLYEMGFVAAQLGLYEEAVSYYNQLINQQSALAQNAYYQLGNAYLQTGKKKEALSAFRSAYQMNYDAQIKRLAHLQYAKLSYDIGNPYEPSPSVIQEYIKNYPKQSSELQPLLVKSYLYSGNYQATLEAIRQMPQQNTATEKIEQEAAYLLGTEEYNKGNFTLAERYFKQSLKYQHNTEFSLKAQYWLGQTYFQLGDYPQAISKFEQLNKTKGNFDERQQLPYDLGYAYFKAKDFDKAKEMFTIYLKNPRPEFKADAELRLADTHYANNELNEAIDLYNKADATDDYTLFQKAMALGFKGDTEAKIAEMKQLVAQHPQSDYVDDALYEIATAYAANEQFKESDTYFDKVIATSQDVQLVANAEIYKVQNEISNQQEASTSLKRLSDKYQHTAFAEKIAIVAKPYFIKNGDVVGYQKFVQDLGVSINPSEMDELNLTTAKQFYTKKQFDKAIPYYEKYLKSNLNSNQAYQARYELAESYYQSGQDDEALKQFKLISTATNDYQEDAKVRTAQILLHQNKVSETVTELETLVNSNDAKIKSFAQIELMKYYADIKDFSKAGRYADLVLANTKNATAIIEQARVIKARSLMSKGKDSEAQKAFAQLEKSTNPSVAAEALYAKAYYQNKGKAFKSSNETIFKLANNYASEEYWGAKALVVMAKNYLALKDKYQASYTCDQIIANYQDFPEVVEEAKAVKKTIK